MTHIRVRLGAGVLGLALVGGLAAAPTASAAAAAPVTVEEQRLDQAAPQEILRRSGFDTVAPGFARALERAGSFGQAERVVVRQGARLWQRAVDRAQGRGPAGGDLSRDDDRPLYWARLGMTREVRQWEPEFGLTDMQRARLMAELEENSRGENTIRYPHAKGVKRILLTGFDPFTLDRDVRISNPSGATALALDGTTILTADGPARIETAVFPVRWQDFAEGTVERTLRRQLPRVDLFTTVSQGRVGRFDVERTNGAWRGGFPDNENVSRTETIPVTDPVSQPQWTSTTLPYARIVAAPTGRFPVYDHTSVTEIPAGGTDPVVRPDGPTPGSTARAGGGGDYLSNEIAYRATLLRDRLGLHDSLSGGHVHTPVLQFGTGNTDPATGTVTDPEFVRNRLDIIAQVRAIVTVAVSGTGR
ncbi:MULTISPECIES: pyroglutamyl peptidase [Streptomyces]|uniref:Pyroglutamyl peptidase n=1 Tax=Streptomyces mirabilis TaxID=68239 RepID=A0ABU3UUM4_9ACTN|nr:MULTISPECIES: pyroglutamyl peptidase [Streptomyces]MCX4608491.1 pyroglutamyl peptidase [Streptomyces mirabilis]MCX5348975.1 pyroglutamyl peptidase [Streptomyces mirabilis]MDU8997631.1 pyroglutamyl peptidase [Streptomyces mirabilis]QDN87509.1 pyroglutamyl peptidase [Streptomyces sp. RLB3-6]QDO08329.1 pyroglutamyl peptidase [Streptomyces sp. S1D4-23]